MPDYNSTLNLPSTDFSMRANLPTKEPEILEKNSDLYTKILKKNEGRPGFILHDGPPFANGDIHIGHAFNKILKDFIVRYNNINGNRAPYIPGWDTHGLPIETQAIKKLGIKHNEVGPYKFRETCMEFAESYVNRQKEQFKRLGVIGDWEHPYITYQPEFEGKQIEVFGEMVKRGYIYKALKPVYWCPNDETALAEAEIEYEDAPCTSIYVKFSVKDDKGLFVPLTKTLDNVYFVIWTTTPWTIPGNMAVCLNADFEYVLARCGDDIFVVAKERLDYLKEVAKIESCEVLANFKGSDLEYMMTSHPLLDRDSLVIVGDHVTLESGTGCVHTAPGFGNEDYFVSKKYNIDIVVPVDAKGTMTEEAGRSAGLKVDEASIDVIKELFHNGKLLAKERITHQYPHCWRCKSPIIFRATEQWFCSVSKFVDKTLEEIKKVKWIPSWGEDRLSSMVSDRSDWCISRQRNWGVPIPAFYCEKCNEPIINDITIKKVSELFAKEGSNAWHKYTASEILGGAVTCKCGGIEFKKETDIMDVWFDSGSSHTSVLETRADHSFPADVYLEGSDQYRGWFQSSLLTAVASRGAAPYKIVVSHGFVVDGEGKKMSKSTGNGVDPLEVINTYGADILRLWVSSTDFTSDVKISKDILKQLSEVYRKIRNTARFILSNINDFDPNKDMVSFDDMEELDRYALMRLNALIKKVTTAFDDYEYHQIFHSVHNFCVVEMSNFYLDILKDRLYVEKLASDSRRSAQSAMYIILDSLTRLLSPVLSFTCEEIWSYLPEKVGQNKESVMLNDIPKYNDKYENEALKAKYDKILEIREDVKKALEIARADKLIGSSLEAKVTLYTDDVFVSSVIKELPSIFIVSAVELGQGEGEFKGETLSVTVSKATGEKCERCWIFSETVSEDKDHPTLCSRCSAILK